MRGWLRGQAINNFCLEMGITRNETEIPLHKLEYHIRTEAEATAPRSLAVLNPLRLLLTNIPEDSVQTVDCRVRCFPRASSLLPVILGVGFGVGV
jgi:glutamyl/glutaminyl-tRNA synthetase